MYGNFIALWEESLNKWNGLFVINVFLFLYTREELFIVFANIHVYDTHFSFHRFSYNKIFSENIWNQTLLIHNSIEFLWKLVLFNEKTEIYIFIWSFCSNQHPYFYYFSSTVLSDQTAQEINFVFKPRGK